MRSISVCLFLALLQASLWPQVQNEEQGQGTRALWDSIFLDKRPGAKNQPAVPAGVAVAPRPPGRDDSAFIGVTLWRLRQSLPSDEKGVRMFLHRANPKQEWTPERIGADGLAWGEQARLSIEVDREGFLYVIDRERFASGAVGDPTLLFPTRKLRRGNNHVIPGTLVDIPAWDEDPPYLSLQRNREDHVGEALTILVTPTPLSGIEIGDDPLPLAAGLVATWEKRWGVPYKLLDAPGLAGRPITPGEKYAAYQEKTLTPNDPPPQTLYRLTPKAHDPLLITIPVAIR